jgi:hypothetical protein
VFKTTIMMPGLPAIINMFFGRNSDAARVFCDIEVFRDSNGGVSDTVSKVVPTTFVLQLVAVSHFG